LANIVIFTKWGKQGVTNEVIDSETERVLFMVVEDSDKEENKEEYEEVREEYEEARE
jgi:hypothetical protein